MKEQCIQAVTEAAGRPLSKGETNGIEERVLGAMRDLNRKNPSEWASMSEDERHRAAAKLAGAKYVQSVAENNARLVRNLERKAVELNTLDSYKPGLQGQLAALAQRLFYNAGARNGQSLEMEARTLESRWAGALTGVIDPGKFFGLLSDPKGQADVLHAMFGGEGASPEAVNAARAVHALLDLIHQRKNDAGIKINYLDNWRLPQPWDWTRAAGANKARFIDDVMTRLDKSQYINRDGSRMSEDQIRKLVEDATETVATGGANKRGRKEQPGYGGALGAKENAPRQLHIKDADGYRYLMDKYGATANLYDTLARHIHNSAKEVAAAERFSTDADAFVRQMVDRALAADANALDESQATKRTKVRAKLSGRGVSEEMAHELDAMRRHVLKTWDYWRNPEPPGRSVWGNISRTLRSVVTASLLGGSPLYAPQDYALAAVYAKASGLEANRLFGRVAANARLGKNARENAARMGIMVDNLQNAAHRLGIEDFSNGFSRFLNHGLFVASGQRALDRALRVGFAETVMDKLGSMIGKASRLDDLGEADADYLRRTGATDEHMAVWKLAELERGPHGNLTLLTPDAVDSVPDEALRPLAEKSMTAVSDSLKAEIDKRNQRNMEEGGWLHDRLAKFKGLEQRVKATLDRMRARASVKEGHAEGVHEARMKLLEQQLNRAEIERKLAATLAKEHSQDAIRGIMAEVAKGQAEVEAQYRSEPGATDANGEPVPRPTDVGRQFESGKPDTIANRLGSKALSIGQEIGRRRAVAEHELRQSKARLDRLARENKAQLDEKTKQLNAKLAAHAEELDAFTQKVRDRVKRRQDYIDAFERQYGAEIDREIRRLRSSASKQLLSTALSETQAGARPATGGTVADDVRTFRSKLRPGTFGGELAEWALLLKRTPFGIFTTHMLDIPKQFDSAGARWAYRAAFMTAGSIMGGVAIQLRNLALGNDPQDVTSWEFQRDMLMASGGFGILGDFILSDKGDHSNGTLTKAMGPGATAVEDTITLLKSMAGKTVQGDATAGKTGAQLLRFAHSYAAPFTRLWYLKAAVNHLAYVNAMDKLSPGYSMRVRRMMAKRNQSSWWSPGDQAPHRAPSLAPMVGEAPR